MTRSRDFAMVAALALVLAVTGRAWPDGRKEAAPTAKPHVKVYALGELATRAGDHHVIVSDAIFEVIYKGLATEPKAQRRHRVH